MPRKKPHRGISYYTTRDRVRVARLHYTADPDKDPATPAGTQWLETTLAGWTGGVLGADWQQEYELNFRVERGKKVWQDFDQTHYPYVTYDPNPKTNPDAPNIEKYWNVWMGVDWGTQNKTVFTAHAIESSRRVYLFDELVYKEGDEHRAPSQIAEDLKKKVYFDRIVGYVGDPAIWRQYFSDRAPKAGQRPTLTSVGKMFQEHGILIQRGPNHEGVDSDYITLLDDKLWLDKTDPIFMISRDCEETIDEFRKVQWLQHVSEATREKTDAPEKIRSKNVDAFDSCKYLHMSTNFEDPDIPEVPYGSAQWVENEMIRESSEGSSVFG
jgi:hypothetical protein